MPDHRRINFAAMLCLYRNNIAAEVEEALVSAFDNQILPPSQLIVVFDGPVSSDVVAVIDRFAQQNDVVRVVFDECFGHGAARAAAINACKYDWVAIIDADDVSMPHRFDRLFELAIRNPESAVIGGGLIEFELVGGEKVFGHTVTYPAASDEVRRYLAIRSPIAQPTSILRVAAIKAVGNFQHWFNNEDYYLWIRLVSAGYDLLNVPEPVLWFRTNPNLFVRRGGARYWWNEVRLQFFSYRKGVTTLGRLLSGAIIRFVVQVVMPANLRAFFYARVLRKL